LLIERSIFSGEAAVTAVTRSMYKRILTWVSCAAWWAIAPGFWRHT